jgi:hypothetical protein
MQELALTIIFNSLNQKDFNHKRNSKLVVKMKKLPVMRLKNLLNKPRTLLINKHKKL